MNGRKGVNRTDDQRALDDLLIEGYLLKGMTVDEITANVNIDNGPVKLEDGTIVPGYTMDRSQIYRDMKRIRKKWAERSEVHRELYINIQLKRLEIEYAECWRGYKKSEQALTEKMVKRRGADGSSPKLLADALENVADPRLREKIAQALTVTVEQMSKEVERLPSYRWLERMLAIHERTAKLLGLDEQADDAALRAQQAVQVNVHGYRPMERAEPLVIDHATAAEYILGNLGLGTGGGESGGGVPRLPQRIAESNGSQ